MALSLISYNYFLQKIVFDDPKYNFITTSTYFK